MVLSSSDGVRATEYLRQYPDTYYSRIFQNNLDWKATSRVCPKEISLMTFFSHDS